MTTIKGVRERPILFSSPMVRAILDGRKTQTRRVFRLPEGWTHDEDDLERIHILLREGVLKWPYGTMGERLWVRETWSGRHVFRNEKPSDRCSFVSPDGPHLHDELWYWADGNPDYGDWERPRPSIHMPRWACRILLDVVDVRVERLNDISEMDARAEGISQVTFIPDDGFPPSLGYMVGKDDGKLPLHTSAKECFKKLWDDINGKRAPWDSSPWVWVITFKRVEETSHGDL